MGFESFQVRLQGPRPDAAAIDTFLLSLPRIQIDDDAFRIGDARYYVWSDADHVIEIELDGNPARLSARFMLCNPESIPTPFAELLLQLHGRFGGRIVICDEVPRNQPNEFTTENLEEFHEVLRQSIAARRAEWTAQFGPRVLPAKSRDVYREFILPLCEPVTEKLSPSSPR